MKLFIKLAIACVTTFIFMICITLRSETKTANIISTNVVNDTNYVTLQYVADSTIEVLELTNIGSLQTHKPNTTIDITRNTKDVLFYTTMYLLLVLYTGTIVYYFIITIKNS